jgi:hypothetical protein
MLLKRYLSATNEKLIGMNLVKIAACGNIRTSELKLVTSERFPEDFAPGSVKKLEVEFCVERFPARDLYRCTITRWVGARFYVYTYGSWQITIGSEQATCLVVEVVATHHMSYLFGEHW